MMVRVSTKSLGGIKGKLLLAALACAVSVGGVQAMEKPFAVKQAKIKDESLAERQIEQFALFFIEEALAIYVHESAHRIAAKVLFDAETEILLGSPANDSMNQMFNKKLTKKGSVTITSIFPAGGKCIFTYTATPKLKANIRLKLALVGVAGPVGEYCMRYCLNVVKLLLSNNDLPISLVLFEALFDPVAVSSLISNLVIPGGENDAADILRKLFPNENLMNDFVKNPITETTSHLISSILSRIICGLSVRSSDTMTIIDNTMRMGYKGLIGVSHVGMCSLLSFVSDSSEFMLGDGEKTNGRRIYRGEAKEEKTDFRLIGRVFGDLFAIKKMVSVFLDGMRFGYIK
ncbi:hypothetical protein KAT92_00945 [Candidatus Babeliales bacterium]|nr:hypothetical protein [Candidatus Babeliales bacterium]